SDPAFPVIANATAEAAKDAGRARRLLADQLTAAVRWVECMQHAARIGDKGGGAGGAAGARLIEIGPGGELAGLLKRIVPDAEVERDAVSGGVRCFRRPLSWLRSRRGTVVGWRRGA